MRYLLFDHDGVLVDTESWYYQAGARALADIGVALDKGINALTELKDPVRSAS